MRLVLCVVLLSLVLSIVLVDSSAQSQLGCTPSTCAVTVNRTTRVNDWGTTVVNDSISVNATAPVTFIDLGVPSSVSSSMGFYSAYDSLGTRLPLSKQPLNATGGYVPLRVSLPGTAGTYAFTMAMVFSGLLNFTENKYVFTYSPFPVVDSTLRLTTATLTVETGDWSSISAEGIQGTISPPTFRTNASPLNPYNTTLGKLSFASSTQNALEAKASRAITIASSVRLHVADTYNITNQGRDVPNVSFQLPKGATGMTASDIVGPLEDTRVSSTRQPNDTVIVTVTPRFGSIKNDGGAYTKLEYDLPSEGYLTALSLGKYTLSFQMLDNVKFMEPTLQTRINFPTGFKLDSVTGQTPIITEGGVLLEASAVSPLSDLSFSMSFTLDPFWASFGQLGLAGLVEAAVAAAVLVGGAGGAAVSGMAPSSLVARLVELFDEKAALRLESERLEEDMSRGGINRHDFRRRRRTIDLRLSEIDRQLSPVENEISSSQSRYGDMVRRVDRAEAELQVVRSSIADLRNRYRSGGVARDSYESLMSDLLRRKERAQQTIDNVVIGLREEAR